MLAAFSGTKCYRCAYSEKKYGQPVQCDQCKQHCAFERKEHGHRVEGKLLCWLCRQAYKRALAKAKGKESSSGNGDAEKGSKSRKRDSSKSR